jgi:hypothetical protein
MTKFYDMQWDFADGQTVTFAGVSRIQDVRKHLKELKRKPGMEVYSRKLTRKPFTMSEHRHCPDCRPCTICRKAIHTCAGHA